MSRSVILALLALAIAGCVKTGLGSDEQKAQRDAFGQDAYEKAMIKAGRGDELKAEKEKWAKSQGEGQGQDLGQGAVSVPAKDK